MMKLVGWAQSVVTFHGGASQHLDGVAFIFRLHLVLGMTLFLLFPFSRLVHIWSVPVEYLTRKYRWCALVTKRILVCIDPASAGFFMGTVRGELSDALRLSDLQEDIVGPVNAV